MLCFSTQVHRVAQAICTGASHEHILVGLLLLEVLLQLRLSLLSCGREDGFAEIRTQILVEFRLCGMWSDFVVSCVDVILFMS